MGSGGNSRMRRSKRSTSGVEQLVRQPDAERGEDGVDELAAGRRAVLVRPDPVEVVPAGAQRLVQRRGAEACSPAARSVSASTAARSSSRSRPRASTNRVLQKSNVTALSMTPSVPDRTPRAVAPAEAARGRWRETAGRATRPWSRAASRQCSAGVPSRGDPARPERGRSTPMRLRSMLPHAGHMSVRVSRGAPSGVRKRWRHSPHWYSLLPGIVVLPSRSHD